MSLLFTYTFSLVNGYLSTHNLKNVPLNVQAPTLFRRKRSRPDVLPCREFSRSLTASLLGLFSLLLSDTYAASTELLIVWCDLELSSLLTISALEASFLFVRCDLESLPLLTISASEACFFFYTCCTLETQSSLPDYTLLSISHAWDTIAQSSLPDYTLLLISPVLVLMSEPHEIFYLTCLGLSTSVTTVMAHTRYLNNKKRR